MTRRFLVLNASSARALAALLASALVALVCAASAGALTFTPGDPVVYRVGTGSETLAKDVAATTFLDEFSPAGLVEGSVAFPTSESGASKRLTASGTGTSEGELTLSANREFLLAMGYNAALGTVKLSETLVTGTKPVARVVGRVSNTGVVDTTTALTDFANGNNPRSAASEEGVKIYVGGVGKTTTGGVHFTELGKTTSTSLNVNDTNVRQVQVVNKQLYTSADPTKAGELKLAKVGTGLPTTTGQEIKNLPFETAESAPKQAYQYAMLTLGLGSEPDTIYVADDERQAIVKYCLQGGVWKELGSVEVPFVRGVIANDVGGTVTIYATGSEQGIEGTLYTVQDLSGFGGTFSDVAEELTKAPLNEGYRGLAWAPGTTIGSGGTPPSHPSIQMGEGSMAVALGDPTSPTTDPITVSDPAYNANELTVVVHSSDPTAAPPANISVTGSGEHRVLHVTPAAVGESRLSITVEAPNGSTKSALVRYGVSADQPGDNGDRYYAGAGNASTAIDVGGGYMILGDDETNVLHLYHERHSSEPVKSYNFTGVLPYGQQEMDIEASARAGNMLYWMGSESNTPPR